MDAPEKRRWYCPTPGWLIYGSLLVTGLLWLSNWLGWPVWHKGYAVLAAVAGVGVVLAVMLLWWLVALVFRWRFQFRLRTLLVLTVVVALPCSWLGLEMKRAKQQRDAVAAIRRLGGNAIHDREFDVTASDDGDLLVCLAQINPPAPLWLRTLVGNDFFTTVDHVTLRVEHAGARALSPEELHDLRDLLDGKPVHRARITFTDAGLEYIRCLKQVKKLDLSGTQVTDERLELVRGLSELQELNLSGTRVTDAALEHIVGLAALASLDLSGTDVTGASLDCLNRLPNLRVLSLDNTGVTNRAMEKLARLTQLDSLYLQNTKVTDAGLGSCEA